MGNEAYTEVVLCPLRDGRSEGQDRSPRQGRRVVWGFLWSPVASYGSQFVYGSRLVHFYGVSLQFAASLRLLFISFALPCLFSCSCLFRRRTGEEERRASRYESPAMPDACIWTMTEDHTHIQLHIQRITITTITGLATLELRHYHHTAVLNDRGRRGRQ